MAKDKDIESLLKRYPNPKSVLNTNMLERSGAHNYLTQDAPALSGFLEGALMGRAPDELDDASVLDPLTAARKAGASYGFPVGVAAQVAPLAGLAKGAATRIVAETSPLAGSLAAQRGAIYTKLPPALEQVVADLAAKAKKAHPEAKIEFASNGLGGSVVRGELGGVDAAKLKFNVGGTSLHTHGYADQDLPSYKDFAEWASNHPQQYVGVVKPQTSGPGSAVVIAPKGTALPNEQVLAQFQKMLAKSNPKLVDMLDISGETDASKWKWLLDAGARDNIDLFLHNIEKPPFKYRAETPLNDAGHFASGGLVSKVANGIVGSSGFAKQVGNAQDAVRSIAAGNGSLSDLNSLRNMAASLGYTSPGLSQALGLAGAAKSGYNMVKDPTVRNAANFAATVNPVAAQALGFYNAATNPNPGTLVDAIASLNPVTRAYNALAGGFNFASLGQVLGNLNKISDPSKPAQLRDMFSNNPNSAAMMRQAEDLAKTTGMDPMDAVFATLAKYDPDLAAAPSGEASEVASEVSGEVSNGDFGGGSSGGYNVSHNDGGHGVTSASDNDSSNGGYSIH